MDRELAREQAFVDQAYRELERMRATARRRLAQAQDPQSWGIDRPIDPSDPVDPLAGARAQRDSFVHDRLRRVRALEEGEGPLVFGRMDTEEGEQRYIGRMAVSDERHNPLVLDWRVPAAEPFYRATPGDPTGLTLRRHLLCEGQRVVDIADQRFGDDAAGDPSAVVGGDALSWALDRERTGRMHDIVATIQREQDEVIRAPLEGVLVVRGGPGTGKTVVALHRAAYLLFTYRQRLGPQGMLVVGPNRVFLHYIEHVLPALGESGVTLSTVEGLVDDATVRGRDEPAVARLKGDARMARVIARALEDRRRPLTRDATIPGLGTVTMRQSRAIRAEALAAGGPHNAGRPVVERGVLRSLGAPRRARRNAAVRRLCDRLWPVLSPAELVHDLLGSRALLDSAAHDVLHREEVPLLYREWSDHERAPWTPDDLPLIDEALVHVGHPDGEEGTRAYGHIVADEVQDLTPMQLRMLARRCPSASMTVVGDLAQTTSLRGPATWEEILSHLPSGPGPAAHRSVADLTIGYRTPEHIVAFTQPLRERIAHDAGPVRPVRGAGERPTVTATTEAALARDLVSIVRDELQASGGAVAVVCAAGDAESVGGLLSEAGVPYTEADRDQRIDVGVNLVRADLVKGLEFDACLVVEPAAIASEHGLPALYVALTRSTRRLLVLHARPLPGELGGVSSGECTSGGEG